MPIQLQTEGGGRLSVTTIPDETSIGDIHIKLEGGDISTDFFVALTAEQMRHFACELWESADEIDQAENVNQRNTLRRRESEQKLPYTSFDWTQAPYWAQWAAIDPDGDVYWFEMEPTMGDDTWIAPKKSFYVRDYPVNIRSSDYWKYSLERRPSPDPQERPDPGNGLRFDDLCPSDVMRYGTRLATYLCLVERGGATDRTAENIRHELNHLLELAEEPEAHTPELSS